MSCQSRNIFLAFSGENGEINMTRKSAHGDASASDSGDSSRPSEDGKETGLRRSNRSNKGIAREMFDPSHIPSHSRKSLPPPEKFLKEASPEPPKAQKQKLPVATKSKPTVSSKKLKDTTDDSESESENEAHTDPKKKWCICRKPHDGRFMISCDLCEEWFHGDCVGITVHRGKQMEKKGEEYVCPACIDKSHKKKSAKSASKKDSKEKSGVKLKGYAHGNDTENVSVPERNRKDSTTKSRVCILSTCNNPAQPESIYCSNVCILRHAKESLGGLDKISKSLKVEKPAAKQETKDERIVRKIKEATARGKIAVMCMKTGKIFANASAPLKTDLESFLQKNPTFQRLKIPKAYKEKMLAREKKKKDLQKAKQAKDNGTSDVSKDAGVGKYAEDPDYNPEQTNKQFANPYKQYTPISPRNEIKPKKHKLSHQDSAESKKSKHKSGDHDRRSSLEKGGSSKIPAKRDGRPPSDEKSKDRGESEVRKNVQKTLQGILESRSNGSDDLKMHPDSISKLVSKVEDSLHKLFGGVNSKYKNRYRSIMFNLKDDKNEGLWRKVILGEVTSSSLVKMTAEEMASKELAQWRNRELKQELEMIKELEVAKQAARPVAKITHKGEIAIDEDYSDLTESHLNYSTDKSVPTVAPQRVRRISATQPDNANDTGSSPVDTTSRHNSHLFDLNCLICTGQVKEEDVNLDEAGNRTAKRSTSIILSNEAQATDEKETDEEIIKKIASLGKKRESISEQLENEEMEVGEGDESGDTPEDDETEESSPAAIAMPEPAKRGFRKPSLENFLWTGVITMPELSNFRSNAYAASGNSKELVNCIPHKLAMDGRIHPKVVWEYLARVRSFSNKEVCVIQFHAASEEDRVGYVGMLSYFSDRKRFGVVSNQNTQFVKDIYVAPLLEDEEVPRQLRPLRGPGIPAKHPSMLIGIVVRCVSEAKRTVVDIDRSFARISGLENSGKRKIISTDFDFIAESRAKASKVSSDDDDDDAPYSPEDVLEDNDDEEYNPETADFGDILDGEEANAPTGSDSEEAYDPEKLVFEKTTAPRGEEDTPYDPEEDAERLESSEVKALQEKQAFLEKMRRELEMKKAELAKEEMTLQIQHTAPPSVVPKPKKTVSQTQVDPRVAARMRNQTKTPDAPASAPDDPLHTIYSVLNLDRTNKT